MYYSTYLPNHNKIAEYHIIDFFIMIHISNPNLLIEVNLKSFIDNHGFTTIWRNGSFQ